MNEARIIANLAKATEALAATGDADLVEVADALAMFLANDDLTFEKALGLRPGWRVFALRQERDRLICALASDKRYAAMGGRALAAAISTDLRRYEASSFPRDRRSGHPPSGLNGAFFRVLEYGDAPGAEMIRKILSLGNADALPITQKVADLVVHENSNDTTEVEGA
jgi:hypothetical protein